MTRFTHDEQRTLMTLWCVSQSPLMFGGDLPSNDDWTLSLITNEEVLAVNQQGCNSRELFRDCTCRCVVWTADMPDGGKAVSVSNFDGQNPHTATIPFSEALLPGSCTVRDLWDKKDLGIVEKELLADVPPHGSRIFLVKPI